MGAYILRRLLFVIPTLIGIMIINFTLGNVRLRNRLCRKRTQRFRVINPQTGSLLQSQGRQAAVGQKLCVVKSQDAIMIGESKYAAILARNPPATCQCGQTTR